MLPIFATVITNVADLRKTVWDDLHTDETFSITCTVTAVTTANKSYWIQDGTACCYIRTTNCLLPKAGSFVHINGHIGIDRYNWQRALVDELQELGQGTIPEPISITAEQLSNMAFDDHIVAMHGIVTDVIPDEIDPDWCFLTLRSETGPFIAAVAIDNRQIPDYLIGAVISAKGVAKAIPDGGRRKFKTAQLTICNPKDITIESPSLKDPFESPRIPHITRDAENFYCKSAYQISRMGWHSAKGIVVASLGLGSKALIRTEYGQLIGVELKNGHAPGYGSSITVAGFPETDFFILKLSKAVFRIDEPPTNVSFEAATPLPVSFDMDMVLRDMLGRAICITGKISDQADEYTSRNGLFNLSCGDRIIPIDVSSLKRDAREFAPPGSLIEVTGICALNTGNWSPRDIFPRINGFTVVPRTRADIRVIASPPWWTSGRLLVVIAILLVALMIALIWNRVLSKLIERRGRQLFKAEVAKAESDLRVDERTRLAAELHDSIAQTLTGVSFQIDAAERTLHENTDTAVTFLNIARKTLLSCREELRRCLWDLRSQALEEDNFHDAIQKTIQPHVEGVDVTIRFNVLRSHLSDTTAHNILSIVRELCINAIRHGHAHHIRIAGENSDGILRFSVRDDGAGFDANNRPGPSMGHFGLQGIKERIKRMHGTLKIESETGKGTRVTVESGK